MCFWIKCKARYKIYIEGVAWSVSQKYILACDSMALVVKPRYYDFLTRNLMPLIHYWPVDKKKMCESIKNTVEWGNKHTDKVYIHKEKQDLSEKSSVI